MTQLNLKGERVKRGLTQKDMAKMLGISAISYRNKEIGRYQFTLDEAMCIAKKFKIPVEELFLANDINLKRENN